MTIPALPNEMQRFHTGSRFICTPAVMDTDDDWVILVSDMNEAANYLSRSGWRRGGSTRQTGEGTDFVSYKLTTWVADPTSDNPFSGRADTDNAIVTSSHMWYHKMKAATSLAKRLNLTEKADRIALFAAVMDNVIDEDYMRESVALAPPFLPLPEQEASPQLDMETWAQMDAAIVASDSAYATLSDLTRRIQQMDAASNRTTFGTIPSRLTYRDYSDVLENSADVPAESESRSIWDRLLSRPALPRAEGSLVRFRRFIPFN